METLYTEKQMIEFANYVLSDERTNKVIESSMEQLEERLNTVSHADIENYKATKDVVEFRGENGEIITILR